MITFLRILQAGMRNFLRNAWLSTAATAVMTITLILMTFSFISNSALSSTIKNVTDKIDVTIYLKDSVTQEQVSQLKKQIAGIANVQSVQYGSKADALNEYRKQNAGNSKLLEALSETENPLPAKLRIEVKDPNNLASVADFINKTDIKSLQSDPPNYSGQRKTTIDKIVNLSQFFKRTSLIASLIFVVISILIIFNTIRMAIFTRRSEIEIMQLVGATNWFIRGPFLVEAAMYGVIAALLALIFCYSSLLVGASKLSSFIDIASTVHFFRSSAVLVISAEVAIGVVIGVVASIFAMSRHLKL
jgi:cell division transport system permease protein